MTRKMGIALAAALILAAAAIPSYHLTVTGEGGERLWTLPARPGTPVILAYMNSIYLAPTEELLTVTARGFKLHAVRSTSEAVLSYNGLDAPYTRDGAWYVAGASQALPGLVLRIGRTGRQWLIVGGRTVPLYQAGEGARLRVDVERVPRLLAVFRAWAFD